MGGWQPVSEPAASGWTPVEEPKNAADEHLSHGFWQSIADAASGLVDMAKRRATGGGQSDYEELAKRAHTPGLENLKEDLKTIGGPISQPILKLQHGNPGGALGDVVATGALAASAGASGGVQAETEALARRQALFKRLGVPPEVEAEVTPAAGNTVANMRQMFNLYKLVKRGIDPTHLAEKGIEKLLDYAAGETKVPTPKTPGELTLREFINKAKEGMNPVESKLADHIMANSGEPEATPPAAAGANQPVVQPTAATTQPVSAASEPVSAPAMPETAPAPVAAPAPKESIPVSREKPITAKAKVEEPDLEELLRRSVEQVKPGSAPLEATADVRLKSKALAAEAHKWGFTPDELSGTRGQEGNPLGRLAYEAGVISKDTYESGWRPSPAMLKNSVEELIKLKAGPPKTIADLMQAFREAKVR